MDNLPIPPLHDIARIVQPTDIATYVALRDYYEQMSAVFNYRISKKLSRRVFSHEVPLQLALSACKRDWSKVGQTQNAEVVKLIWQAGEGRNVKAYDAPSKGFPIRNDILIRVRPSFYFVERDKVSLFVLQPRRTFALTELQLGLLASIMRLSYMTDDFENVGLEILDLSSPEQKGLRLPQTYTLSNLPLLPDSEVEILLQRFATARDLLIAEGVQKRTRKPKSHINPTLPMFED
jgi:hypothetical protein